MTTPGFSFLMTCPDCGGEVELVTLGKVCGLTEARAVVRCQGEEKGGGRVYGCKREWVIEVFVRPVAECPCGGTERGRREHIRRGEEPCEASKRDLGRISADYRERVSA